MPVEQLGMLGIETRVALPVLLLSIRREHADKILSGQKLFELRKALPREPFTRVYLYESGGGGVVGYFEPGRILRKPVDELWLSVGDAATSHDRFQQYYSNAKSGVAVEVVNPVRFNAPISLDRLHKIEGFVIPQSFMLVRPGSKLYRALGVKGSVGPSTTLGKGPSIVAGSSPIRLRRIEQHEHPAYVQWVTAEIGKRYEEITPDFARHALAADGTAQDPFGFLTRKKQVLAIEDGDAQLVGFTTLTFKITGCVKSGPTILFPEFRGRGLGAKIRDAIEGYCRTKRAKKIYCTCPDNDMIVVKYLLRAGFRVEGHLRFQYSSKNGEFVFGKMLMVPAKPKSFSPERLVECGSFVSGDSLSSVSIRAFFRRWFGVGFCSVSEAFAEGAISGIDGAVGRAYETRPRLAYWLGRGKRCLGTVFLVPKRGGSVKGILLTGTSHQSSVSLLIRAAERWARSAGKRKMYFIHRNDDVFVVMLLGRHGYRVEGTLDSAYKSGIYHGVYGKMLT